MKAITLKSSAAALTLLALSAGASSAASITGTVAGPLGEDTVDLSAQGTADWAYWFKGGGSSLAPTNEKKDADLISNVVSIGNSANVEAGSRTSSPSISFTYDDGVSPASGTVERPGVFNGVTGVPGIGLGVSIVLPTTKAYRIEIWVAAYNLTEGQATLNASIGDAIQYTDSSISHSAATPGTKDTYLYTLTATADNPGDTLDITLVGNRNGEFAHVLVSAIAVSPAQAP